MFLFLLFHSIQSQQFKVLALLGSQSQKSEYSQFFGDLTNLGCDIVYKVCESKQIQLERFGTRLYDAVVILCNRATCFGNSAEDLKEYLENGGNAIVFDGLNGHEIQERIYSYLSARVTSSNTITDIKSNSKVVLRKIVAPKAIVPNKVNPLLFEGGFSVIDRPNEFRFPIVVGGLEHFSAQNKIHRSTSVANDLIPISAYQSRVGGRILIVNSHNFASNELYEEKITIGEDFQPLSTPIENGNRQLMIDLAKWAIHYSLHVKITSATHYDPETQVSPVQYHIKQNITVVANVSFVEKGEWKPYQGNDVQVEIFMLGTFIRRHMKLAAPGTYTETLMLPDRAGNYWIKVFTDKEGWMNAREEMAIAVRPLAIREKEKFLTCAQPYQFSMVLIMAATFIAAVHFLYHKPSN